MIGDLVVVPLVDAAAASCRRGKTGGVWSLPAAGLTQGAKCSVLDGELVAAATADSVAFGKITGAAPMACACRVGDADPA
ncbi:hypothetical protein PU463_00029435 [Pseudomonas aeruginosa]